MQRKAANDKLRNWQPPDQDSTQKEQMIWKTGQVLYIQSTQVDTCSHKAKKYYNNVQASSSDDGSKPMITLSAMGFISSTYLENFSPEQPTTTPSPIRAKFAERKKKI